MQPGGSTLSHYAQTSAGTAANLVLFFSVRLQMLRLSSGIESYDLSGKHMQSKVAPSQVHHLGGGRRNEPLVPPVR